MFIILYRPRIRGYSPGHIALVINTDNPFLYGIGRYFRLRNYVVQVCNAQINFILHISLQSTVNGCFSHGNKGKTQTGENQYTEKSYR